MQANYTTKSATETIKLGEELGTTLRGGDLVLLAGELGGGKTQFAKGIAKALGIGETVVSPTFTIERSYQGKTYTLHHLDLYRTQDDREIYSQIQEYISSPLDITVIEWPENMVDLKTKSHYLVNFTYTDDDNRAITFSKVGAEWS